MTESVASAAEANTNESALSRVTASRHNDRILPSDWSLVAALLAEVPIVHVGFIRDGGQPFVIPIAAASDGPNVLLHGSTGSRWLRQLATGIAVSAAVTSLDALVVARSAFESSMHYRSAVIFGACEQVDGAEKLVALDVLTEALIPGRVAEVRRPTTKELAATIVLRLVVEEFSLKTSSDWSDDPDTDISGSAWAGVVPMHVTYQTPLNSPNLADGIPVPLSILRLSQA